MSDTIASFNNRALARGLDLVTGIALLIPASPCLAALALYGLATTGQVLRKRRGALTPPRRRFSTPDSALGLSLRRSRLDRLAQVLDLILGEAWLVGPRLRPSRSATLPARPYGWVSTAFVRARMNVLFGEGDSADREDLQKRSLGHSLAVLFKAALALILGRQAGDYQSQIEICQQRIDNRSLKDALAELHDRLTRAEPLPACPVAFLNADSINKACADPKLRASLAACHRVYADGFGLKIAAALHSRPLLENVNGTDLVPRLLDSLRHSKLRIYLFGARPEVVAAYASKLQARGLTIAGHQHGYLTPQERAALPERIRESRADLVLVALGAPYQEAWLVEHLAATGARVGIAVGGLFDFESGRIPRAPQALRELGLEWTYRLWQEPGRMWRRYILGNPIFLARALQSAWSLKLANSRPRPEGSLS